MDPSVHNYFFLSKKTAHSPLAVFLNTEEWHLNERLSPKAESIGMPCFAEDVVFGNSKMRICAGFFKRDKTEDL